MTMNFKPNLWTVLFLIAAGVIGYQAMSNNSETPSTIKEDNPLKTEPNVGPLISIQLKNDQVISHYQSYQRLIFPALESAKASNPALNIVENLKVEFFRLDDQLMETFTYLNKDKEVYAMPVLKEDPKTNLFQIDLVFSTVSPDDPNFETEAAFFDFSKPCPTLCPDR